MKAISLALLLAGSLSCCPSVGAQPPAPAPNAPNLNQLFRFQPSPGAGQPRFKLQMPEGKPYTLPRLNIVGPLPPAAKQGKDPGMILKPRRFEQQPSKPAQPGKIYPDLKIMPIQIASLDLAPAAWPKTKFEPIPRIWPNAKIEPIPTTWQDYRVIPVDASLRAEKP
jgi:hypothetical protein